ncbi:methyltransferase domain-containing protein [Candidatus Woesearchaeota archaeon]|nr:methyltransferase domain-containing protein [Candidatus Woesearchaeota archaeon]
MIKKILITDENRKFFVKDTNKDFHTHLGIVSKSDLKKKHAKLKTNTKNELTIYTPTKADLLRKIKRGAAIILPKDIGYIIAETALNNKSKILDAGTGSAALAISLALVSKHVYSYEVNEKHYQISKENIEELKLKNITLKNKDISTAKETNIDLMTLDMPEPWHYITIAESSLKDAGFLITYLPTITQVIQMVESVERTKFRHMKTIELIERSWHVEGKRVRPKSKMIGHTAFLSFFRKI